MKRGTGIESPERLGNLLLGRSAAPTCDRFYGKVGQRGKTEKTTDLPRKLRLP
jgi:hypothetical protein